MVEIDPLIKKRRRMREMRERWGSLGDVVWVRKVTGLGRSKGRGSGLASAYCTVEARLREILLTWGGVRGNVLPNARPLGPRPQAARS